MLTSLAVPGSVRQWRWFPAADLGGPGPATGRSGTGSPPVHNGPADSGDDDGPNDGPDDGSSLLADGRYGSGAVTRGNRL